MKPIRTVIVDDNARFLESLGSYLSRRETIDVVEVTDTAQAAMQAISRHQPDLVLVDLVMPSVDGLALTRQIKALDWPPAVIVMTLAEHHSYQDRAMSAGADGLISKYEVTTRLMPLIMEKVQAVREQPRIRLAWSAPDSTG